MTSTYVKKVVNIFAQIIQTTDHQVELDTIYSEMEALLMIHQEDIIQAFFNEFLASKEKMFAFARKYLLERTATLKDQNEFEMKLASGIHTVLIKLDPTSEYFKAFSKTLTGLKVFKNPNYSHKLLDIISEFKSSVDDKYGSFEFFIDILDNINTNVAYFKDGSSPSNFIRFFNHVVARKLLDIESEPTRAKIFQLLASVARSVRDTDIKPTLEEVFNIIEVNLPLPSDTAKLYFSSIEPLLFCFHYLAFKVIGSLPTICGLSIDGTPLNEEEKAKKEIFTRRLQFAYTQSGEFVKQLKSRLSSCERQEAERLNRFLVVVENVRKLLELLKQPKPKILFATNEMITPSWKKPKGALKKKPEGKKEKSNEAKTDRKRSLSQGTSVSPTKKPKTGPKSDGKKQGKDTHRKWRK